jgi:hypothetical protein
MTERAFTSYKAATAYAKQLAKKHGGVRLVRNGSEYIVKIIATSGASAHVKPERLSLHPKTYPTDPSTPSVFVPIKSAAEDRLCVECGVVIPQTRVVAVPTVSRCIKCQSAFEHSHDTRPHINEGLAGTRDENKKMRGQLRGDMRNRGRGG